MLAVPPADGSAQWCWSRFATVCDLLLPTIMNDILNHGVRQSDFAYIVRCCVWMLAVAAAGLAALLAGRKISCDVVAGFNADLRTDVFSLVNNMTFEEFNAIGAAALLSRSTYDIGTVSWVASMISGSLITIPVLFFGGVILALRKDVTMSLIPAAVRPGDLPDRPAHQQAHRALCMRPSDKYIDIQNDVMRERLHGIRVIRAFNKEASLQQKIADATHVMAENIINANVQMGLLEPGGRAAGESRRRGDHMARRLAHGDGQPRHLRRRYLRHHPDIWRSSPTAC
ncbi:MAG: ABC transporter transmembrane domain-containing protein [Oscillospiraceae bacterium]